MKVKAVITVLALACVALAGALWYRHSLALETEAQQLAAIQNLSSDLAKFSTQLESQRAVNLKLEEQVERWKSESAALASELAAASNRLLKTQTDAKATADAASASLQQRDVRIKEVEGERDELTRTANELKEMIATLETAIGETKRQLAASVGDREFLAARLKQLQSEKSELEGKFNDVAALREQVRRVREDVVVARRREWIKRGLYASDSAKGAERLVRGFAASNTEDKGIPAAKPNYNLDVELRREGVAPADKKPDTSSQPGK